MQIVRSWRNLISAPLPNLSGQSNWEQINWNSRSSPFLCSLASRVCVSLLEHNLYASEGSAAATAGRLNSRVMLVASFSLALRATSHAASSSFAPLRGEHFTAFRLSVAAVRIKAPKPETSGRPASERNLRTAQQVASSRASCLNNHHNYALAPPLSRPSACLPACLLILTPQ